jgi:hypothetical protein
MKQKQQRFIIDFFEFAFLVEACIPPRPIARAMFWDKVIGKYHEELTISERNKLFEWIERNPCFNLKDKDCRIFHNRYNPHNQFLVTTEFNGKEEQVECFSHMGRYYTEKNRFIASEYITKEVRDERYLDNGIH